MDSLNEEIEVVNSIFEDIITEWSPGIFNVKIPTTQVTVRLRFPSNYPNDKPTIVTVSGREDCAFIQLELERLIQSTFIDGEVYIYNFVDESMSLLAQLSEPKRDDASMVEHPVSRGSIFKSQWITGEPITDRKSVFIGRAIAVKSESDVRRFMDDLLEDNKISKATHNMMAYRIRNEGPNTTSQDYDDDGESAAGNRMLHLLQMTDATDVLVVVSRWYGGVQLGPDRFKHINACARDVLLKGNFVH